MMRTMHDRRQFLKMLARSGMLAALGLISGMVLHRRSAEETCQHNFSCSGCPGSDCCRLPQADNYRLEKARLPVKRPTNG